jgi:ribosome-binding protein aMBF1 (putative translation factor)
MVRRQLAVLATAALVACAAVAAGCGGSSEAEEDYVAAVNNAQTGLAKRFDRLGNRITATSTPQQDRKTLTDYEVAVRDAVGQLRTVEPPGGLDQLHRQFIGEIADYGTEVRKAREKLGTGRPDDAIAAQQALVTAVGRISSRINDTISAINDKLSQ